MTCQRVKAATVGVKKPKWDRNLRRHKAASRLEGRALSRPPPLGHDEAWPSTKIFASLSYVLPERSGKDS